MSEKMLIWLEIRKAVQERYFSNRNSVEFFIWAHDKDYKTVKARIDEIKNLGERKRYEVRGNAKTIFLFFNKFY